MIIFRLLLNLSANNFAENTTLYQDIDLSFDTITLIKEEATQVELYVFNEISHSICVFKLYINIVSDNVLVAFTMFLSIHASHTYVIVPGDTHI